MNEFISNEDKKSKTYDDTKRLYENVFVNKDLVKLTLDQKRSFIPYYLEKKKQNNQKEKVQQITKDIDTGKISVDDKANSSFKEVQPEIYFKKNVVSISSSMRDKQLYPNASDFTIPLGAKFHNVCSITLKSLALPNTQNGIDEYKNQIWWRNEEDLIVYGETTDYSCTIRPGNYTTTALVVELDRVLNGPDAPMRKVPSPNLDPLTGETIYLNHLFLISIDNSTDRVDLTSIKMFPATIPSSTTAGPIYTVINQSFIQVYQSNHGMVVGDTVFISGVKGNVGGISNSLINNTLGELVVSVVVDKNSFKVDMGMLATSSMFGGGTNVKVGKSSPFKLISVLPALNPITLPLGFLSEISGETFSPFGNNIGVIGARVLRPVSIKISRSGTNTLLNLTTVNSFLFNGATVRLSDLFLEEDFIDNDFIVSNFSHDDISGIDTFTLTIVGAVTIQNHWVFDSNNNNYYLPDPSTIEIGTQIFDFLSSSPHKFNSITNITDASGKGILVTTKFSVNVSDYCVNLNTIRISNTLIGLDGMQKVYLTGDSDFPSMYVNNLAANQFLIRYPQGMSSLGSTGNSGILAGDYNFTLSNVDLFYPFTQKDQINNNTFRVVKILTENAFIFAPVSELKDCTTLNGGRQGYIDVNISSGNPFIGGKFEGGFSPRINSNIHGWYGTQTNVNSFNNKTFGNINLSGYQISFLCLKNIGSIITPLLIEDIFASITLTQPPGYYIYSYDSAPKYFEKNPLRILDRISVQVKNPDNNLIDFNGMEFTFSLEIEEKINDKNFIL